MDKNDNSLATPITIASAISGNIPLTIGGAVATGVAQATDNLLEIYKSKIIGLVL